MSSPKRPAKTTSSKSTTSKKAAAKPAAKTAPKAAAKSTSKAVAKTTKKSAPKSPAKPAAKPSAKPSLKTAPKAAKPSAAERVAKKVAKIISKIVAKKKTVDKKPAAASVKAAAKPKAAKPKVKAAKTAAKVAVKPAKATKTTKTAAPAAPKAKPAKPQAAASRRPKSFTPRDVERDFGFPANAPELPEFYGEDRLVLMTKDPEYLFAYWEITPEKQAEGEKIKHRREDYREALRLNWASRDIFERNFAVMPVSLAARKWYLRVPFSGLAYQVEIGWLGESGHFISLLASNPSDAPESWAATRRRLKAAAKSGGLLEHALAGGRPQGSSDLTSKGAPKGAPAPYDWSFTGPGSQTSSFGAAKKPGRRAAR